MASSIHEMLRANCKCDDVAKCVLGLKNLELGSQDKEPEEIMALILKFLQKIK
jgi:hypothetical protein